MTSARPVLVLTNERDYAADRVIHHLTDDLGVEVVRWNAERLGHQVRTWTLDPPEVPSPPFRAVWLRQYLPEPAAESSPEQIDESLILAAQWRAWLSTLNDGTAAWMNPLWAARRAESKIVQLREARSVGLPVPPTMVTTSSADAAQFRAAHGSSVVKTPATAYFAHTDQSFVFTEALTDELLGADDAWRMQPLMVQRRVYGRADVRVVVVDDQVHAAELPNVATPGGQLGRADVDWRLHPGRAWRALTLTDAEADRYRGLVRRLGLRYGAIDLIDDGQTRWFLEVNQAGEFAFLDHSAGLTVAESISRSLAGPR